MGRRFSVALNTYGNESLWDLYMKFLVLILKTYWEGNFAICMYFSFWFFKNSYITNYNLTFTTFVKNPFCIPSNRIITGGIFILHRKIRARPFMATHTASSSFQMLYTIILYTRNGIASARPRFIASCLWPIIIRNLLSLNF